MYTVRVGPAVLPGDMAGEVQLVEAPQDDVVHLHRVGGAERGSAKIKIVLSRALLVCGG